MAGETLLTNLQKIQNRARIITEFEFDALAEPLLREPGILNVRELIRYDTSVKMHKTKYGSYPSYLQEMFHTIAEVHE